MRRHSGVLEPKATHDLRGSAEDRMLRALELGELCIDALSSTAGLTRAQARERFRNNRQLGRKPSRAAGGR